MGRGSERQGSESHRTEAGGTGMLTRNSLTTSRSKNRSAPAPLGAQYLSPGRQPWVRKPSPRLRHPSPAGPPPGGLLLEVQWIRRSGPQGGRERARGRGRVSPTHGWRRGLSYAAPSELNSLTKWTQDTSLSSGLVPFPHARRSLWTFKGHVLLS